ncbi:MAG: hypothetical protein ACFFD1_04180 [Candidatus Thorarchaeota archaeon]
MNKKNLLIVILFFILIIPLNSSNKNLTNNESTSANNIQPRVIDSPSIHDNSLFKRNTLSIVENSTNGVSSDILSNKLSQNESIFYNKNEQIKKSGSQINLIEKQQPIGIKKNNNQYKLTSIININGDNNFSSQAIANGWAGDGTGGNPYIIENLTINTSLTEPYGIFIANTNVSFIIRNCSIYNFSYGIALSNVT